MNAIVVVTKFSTWLMGVHHAGELLGGAALSPRKRDASFPLSRAIHCHELKFAKRRASHLLQDRQYCADSTGRVLFSFYRILQEGAYTAGKWLCCLCWIAVVGALSRAER